MPRRERPVDDPDLIVKRIRFSKKIRRILYGLPDEGPTDPPLWGHTRRHYTWAWMVWEFCSDRSFRYSQLLTEAREYVKAHGIAEPVGLVEDLELLKGFERQLRQRRSENLLRNWRWKNDPVERLKWEAERMAEKELLAGVCPHCGDDLPCKDCGTPAVTLVHGKLVAVRP